jgi:HemK-like putative methylase
MSPTTADDRPPGVRSAALALWAQARARSVAAELGREGIEVLSLKGPDLQSRLYGTPAAYPSADVDLLVRRADAAKARDALERAGWRFAPDNGLLWRAAAQAAYDRDGLRVDLHWGLQVGHLPGVAMRSLERSLWAGAAPGPGPMLEPDPESLAVFLAVHAVGHRFERREWAENVHAALRLVRDEGRMWTIARDAHIEDAVRLAIAGAPAGTRAPVLDGAAGRVASAASWLLRGHFLPVRVRGALRDARSLHRGGYGLLGLGRARIWVFDGLAFRVPRGVFAPRSISEPMVELALEGIGGESVAGVLDVGTGSGAIAIALARRRPRTRVLGVDVSARAVRAARRNARALGARDVRFRVGNLLEPVPAGWIGRVAAVTANVPFVAPLDVQRQRRRDMPMGSVRGLGPDGLGLVRELLERSPEVLRPGGVVVLQLATWQWDVLSDTLPAMGFRLEQTRVSRGATIGRVRLVGPGG